MKIRKSVLFTLIVTSFLPLLVTALLYGRLPQRIPMHWNINGTIRYDPKITIWLVASLSFIMTSFFLILPRIDPKKQNYEKFGGAYQGFIVVMQLLMLVLTGIILSESLNPGHISVSFTVVVAVGLLFAFLGNIMPKVKSNFFIGVRTPWTISDPDVWFKTNRLAGYLFFFSGLLICVSAFLFSDRVLFLVLLVLVGISSIIPILMSYLWFRNK